MQEGQFEHWLLNVRGLSHGTTGSRLSNCRRLETYEGDLDEHFDRDGLEGLIARLVYSSTDERHNALPRHRVPIHGDLRTGSATLKSAATLYQEFRGTAKAESAQGEPSLPTRPRRRPRRPLRLREHELQSVQPPQPNAVPSAFDLAAIIAAGESDRVEFKSSLKTNLHTRKKDSAMETAVIKTIAGFLNTHGGILIVGVKDDGTPIGIDVDGFANEDKMNLHLTNLVNNKIGKHAWSSISAWFDEHRGMRVLVVQCERSATPVYVKEGETFYIRTGNATNSLSVREGHEYISANFPRLTNP